MTDDGDKGGSISSEDNIEEAGFRGLLSESSQRLGTAIKGPEQEKLDRWIKLMAEGAENFSPRAKKCVMMCKPAIEIGIKVILVVMAIYLVIFSMGYKVFKLLPMNAIKMVFGAALCFFGGTYYASIAAIEAFRIFGWETLQANVKIVMEQANAVQAASEIDNSVDDDHDGVADVDQISSQALLRRKTVLAMTTIQEPERLKKAVGNLWTAYVSVLATLRLEFARTTSLALAIVEMIKFPIMRWILPPLMMFLGSDLSHWAKTFVEVTLNVIAMVVAWYMQMIISSFYSAIRGGRLFAEGLIAVLIEKDLLRKLPFFKKARSSDPPEGEKAEFDADESYLDEVIGFSFAGVGFLWQLTSGFALPFPLNLVFFPLTLVEYFLRWQIATTAAAQEVGGAGE
ncbi:hypothetical protein EMIHUDRAFT_432735 [Emiliania huxleyi CCMP1516]|uniref:ABC transmembrane type-1 domain-containing protein n=2 Tax=Emiliania huxleyi TaxID=2903 RepID=A0A0D3IUG8_EMIH1|nr:hypothetical protein EMIHUDRAFT_432735 [Emiliania huxleyi CCMP1516]EOD14903.1 hypothetical protein EMIHUDRAFT_432735 [Emiliania huxleyi CCMP1516]|eukprot:XP_005767332.1 hypothetical protein EMIHUDRAFT_432735 [Emiliania huxleyi CCMP1516]